MFVKKNQWAKKVMALVAVFALVAVCMPRNIVTSAAANAADVSDDFSDAEASKSVWGTIVHTAKGEAGAFDPSLVISSAAGNNGYISDGYLIPACGQLKDGTTTLMNNRFTTLTQSAWDAAYTGDKRITTFTADAYLDGSTSRGNTTGVCIYYDPATGKDLSLQFHIGNNSVQVALMQYGNASLHNNFIMEGTPTVTAISNFTDKKVWVRFTAEYTYDSNNTLTEITVKADYYKDRTYSADALVGSLDNSGMMSRPLNATYLTNWLGAYGSAFYVGAADYAYYADVYRKDIYIVLIIAVLFIVCALFITYLILQITYKPIKDILSQFGDNGIITNENRNEVEYIIAQLKKIRAEKNQLTDTLETRTVELKMQRLGALQAQISPHFTNNTLEAINCISYMELGQENDISKMVRAMSQIFEYTLDISLLTQTIREEYDLTNTYITILRIRTNDALSFDFDIDQTLLNCKILKLSIQPLIENVAKHAFDSRHPKVNVRISIQKHEAKGIRVIVRNNGAGMEKAQLEALCRSINDFTHASYQHIGLRNINERLQLLYGEDAGLRIETPEDGGLQCSFTYYSI